MSVSEEIVRDFLYEGIEIDPVSKTISLNPKFKSHSEITMLLKPHLVYSAPSIGKVYSLFKRESLQEGTAENCFVQALKNENGWKFKNKTDRDDLIRRIIRSRRKLSSDFDTLVMISSEDQLNNEIFKSVRKVAKYENYIKDAFFKVEASEVYYRYYDFDRLKNDINDDFSFGRIDHHIYRDLQDMMLANNVFTYKKTDSSTREYLEKYLRVLNESDLKSRHEINDKNVLVLDDTVSSGKILSDYAFALNATFCPSSITFLTVFSPLGDAETDIYNDSIEVLPFQDL